MKKSFGRILTIAAVLALVGVLAISSLAFAAGPGQGHAHGPGDGTGPLTGGQFGSGPGENCLDLNENGICDCQETE